MRILSVLIGVGSLMISSGVAMASTCFLGSCVYTAQTPITELDYFGSASNGTPYAQEYLSLPVFNESLGTLQSVTITLHAQTGVNNDTTTNTGFQVGSNFYGDPSEFIVNDTNVGAATTVDLQAAFQMYLLDGDQTGCISGITTAGSEATASCLVAAASGSGLSFSDQNIPVGANSEITVPVSLSMTVNANVSSSLMSDFEAPGGGTIALPVYVEPQLSYSSGSGNAVILPALAAGASATVTYDFSTPSSAPEPTSIVLMSTALVSLGLLRRRARRSV